MTNAQLKQYVHICQCKVNSVQCVSVITQFFSMSVCLSVCLCVLFSVHLSISVSVIYLLLGGHEARCSFPYLLEGPVFQQLAVLKHCD